MSANIITWAEAVSKLGGIKKASAAKNMGRLVKVDGGWKITG